MSITYAAALKNARLQAIVNAIDGGSGPAHLEICTAAYGTVLATVPFNVPCGAVSGGVLTFDFPVTDPSADNSGVAAIARIKDGSGNIVVSGLTVGTSGTHVVLSNTSLVSGSPITLNSGSVTHP